MGANGVLLRAPPVTGTPSEIRTRVPARSLQIAKGRQLCQAHRAEQKGDE